MNMPQMLLDKLYKLVLAHVDDEKKVRRLNSRAPRKGEDGFPTCTLNDREFVAFFHTTISGFKWFAYPRGGG